MNRFKNHSKVAYDAQIIVYYCFLYKQYKLTDLTTKSRELTQFLVNNGLNHPSDKSEESPPPSLLRTHRVTFITMGSSKPLSEIVRLYNYLFAK